MFSLAEPPRGRADGRMILSCERSSEPNQSWMYFLEKQPQSKNFHSTKHQERQKKTKNLKQLQQQIHLQVELGFEVSPRCCRDVDRQMCKGALQSTSRKKESHKETDNPCASTDMEGMFHTPVKPLPAQQPGRTCRSSPQPTPQITQAWDIYKNQATHVLVLLNSPWSPTLPDHFTPRLPHLFSKG